MKALVLEDPEWPEDARLAILRLSLTEREFTADTLREVLRRPPVDNWVGLAFTSAKRAGLIEPLASTVSKSKSRNYGSLKIWTRKTTQEEK